jgi:hypothetical protein
MVDLHSGSHPLDKLHTRWDLIEVDADWDALGEAHPREDRVDRSHPLIVGLRVRNINGAGSSSGTLLSSAAGTSANFLLVSIFTCSTCNTCRVMVGSAIALSI